MALGDIPLGETVFFDVVTSSPSTGAVTDADSPPSFSVFEEDTDAPILGPTAMTKRTGLTGNYRGSFEATTGNGLSAGKFYSVVATAAVGGVTGKTVALSFRTAAAEATAGVGTVRLSDGVTHGGTTAVLLAERVVIASETADEPGLKVTGNGTAGGAMFTGGADGVGLVCRGNNLGAGAQFTGGNNGFGNGGAGVELLAGGGNRDGLYAAGSDGGAGLRAVGGAFGPGVYVSATSDNPAVKVTAPRNFGGVVDIVGSGSTATSSFGVKISNPGGGGMYVYGGEVSISLGGGNLAGNIHGTVEGIARLTQLTGVAAGATATTLTLDDNALGIPNRTLIGQVLTIYGGTGMRQSRVITDYNSLTLVATVNRAWDTVPQSGASQYTITTLGAVPAEVEDCITAPQVRDEVDAALSEIHLDRLLAEPYDPDAKPGAADALLNELVEGSGGASRFTAAALAQAPSSGGGADAAAVAAAVRDVVVLTISTPSADITDTDGAQLSTLTIGQVLAALAASLAGDRSGSNTRIVTATIPGVSGVSVQASRVSQSVIEATLVLPPVG